MFIFFSGTTYAVANSQWDCNLKNDGITWDCGISSTPLKKKVKLDAISNAPIKNSKAPTQKVSASLKKSPENNPVKVIQNIAKSPEVPRVQLKRLAPKPSQARTAPTKANFAGPADWNCQAADDGTWDCTKSASSRIAKKADKRLPDLAPVAVAKNNPAEDTELFKQMVSQLKQDPWNTCKVEQSLQASNKQDRLTASVNVTADYTEIRNRNDARFTGDVALQRADQRITADTVDYNSETSIALASGDVFYQENGFAMHSQQAKFQLNNDAGQFQNNRFIMEGSHVRGTSDSFKQVNRDLSHSTNITYTTCAPGQTDWLLEAKELELNNETGRGSAKNVWIEFYDVPFFYTPYITFPIDDRRMSGFLFPTFGTSDTTGAEFSIPYYWNIAPNYDATFTPRIMSDRGLMLGAEFRHLGDKTEGQIAAEILNDSTLDELRGQLSIQNITQFSSRLTSDIDLNYISDDDYLEDFGNSLFSSSDRYIKSQAEINYRADHWSLAANLENYDAIDETISSSSRPHRRLPQITFKLKPIDLTENTSLAMRNEFVYFDHSADVRAKRTDLQPSISHKLRTPGSFITSKLSLRHTDYQLDNQALTTKASQSRTIPILSLDSGLFFERDLKLAGGITQTLEPRAYYLFVPHKNQDDIPLFDTSEYSFNINQLFRENRFSGADRIGDANQLSLAVTSRFIEQETGKERLRASVGTIVYFDDLDVTLNPASQPISQDSSDIIGELNAKISDRWTARSTLQYNPHAARTQKASAGLHYRNGPNKLFNASYRSRYSGQIDSNGHSKDIEQTDISFKWPLTKEWSSVGRWNYSEEHNLTLESFIGLEKDTCCWRFTILAKNYVNDAFDEEPKQGLFFQLELKGLTSFGNKVESILEEGILGYTPPNQK